MAKTKTVSALVLFSGGLDSMLAAKTLMSQGIKVIGICFSSNFFDCARARESAKIIGIDLIEENISEKILSIVKCPSCGYGKNMNPCIDCHSLMIREAAKYLKPEIKKDRETVSPEISGAIVKAPKGKDVFDFLASGEVLGQRPFSQNKEALARVAVIAGVEVLRPLSAKLLPETAIEKKGLINRSKLLAVKGRSREEQMKLAKELGIKNYPSPAGGCLLTDPEGAKKVLDIIVHCPDCKTEDVELLKYGRVFWLKLEMAGDAKMRQKTPKITLSLKNSLKLLIGKNLKDVKAEADINFHWVMVIIGRDKDESERLERLAKNGDIVVKLDELTGPTTLARLEKFKLPAGEKTLKIAVPEKLDLKKMETEKIKSENEILGTLGLLTGYYATKARGKNVLLNVRIK
jgi:diphthamide synthase (EF-2-diphthine--ammonia ligase)